MAAALEPHSQLYRDMMRSVRADLQNRLAVNEFDQVLEEMQQVLPKGFNVREGTGEEAMRLNVVPVTVLSGFLGGGYTWRVADSCWCWC